MRLSALATRIATTGDNAWALHQEALAAQARGEDVIVLTIGDPDRDSPAAVVEAAVRALRAGDTHYVDSRGRLELRYAIAERQSHKQGSPVCPENVTVHCGAQGAVFAAAMCLFGAGDEVLIPAPSYVSYGPVIAATGAIPISVPAHPKTLRFDGQFLAAAVTSRTRGMIYADPANPTGAVLRAQELEAIAQLAVLHEFVVIADEIYAELAWGTTHTGIARLPCMANWCVTIGGLSKSHAMTGWRVGWTIAPAHVAAAINEFAALSQNGTPGFIQEGALEALVACDQAARDMAGDCRRRAYLVLSALGSNPAISCVIPEAGMFVLADVSRSGLPAPIFARRLWQATGVAVMDGGVFGNSTADYVRLSLAAEDEVLAEACRRINAFCTHSAVVEDRFTELLPV